MNDERFPGIPWHEPTTVEVPGVGKRLACRLCIATKGLKASELLIVDYAFDSRAAFDEHMAAMHQGPR